VNQGTADEVRRLADKGDDFERVVPGTIRALAKLRDQLTPSGNGFQSGQWLEFEAADQIEQRLVLCPDAGQFHALVAQAA